MKKLTALFVMTAAVLLTLGAGTGIAVAADGSNAGQNQILDHCQYLPLATNLAFPKKFGKTNTSVCVDVPVHVEKARIVFNMDTHTVDGKGNATGLKHMVMMGHVMKDAIAKGQIKPENVDIIGIVHGSALPWVTKKGAKSQMKWIKAIFKLKREGVNIHLEACGAAMNGHHLTRKNLVTYDANGNPDPKAGGRIYVNQGAIARDMYLVNHGYVLYEEGQNFHGK